MFLDSLLSLLEDYLIVLPHNQCLIYLPIRICLRLVLRVKRSFFKKIRKTKKGKTTDENLSPSTPHQTT